ncbi:MAG: hypothetical protein WAU36_11805 [Cyclobacteriaceae bacterium]
MRLNFLLIAFGLFISASCKKGTNNTLQTELLDPDQTSVKVDVDSLSNVDFDLITFADYINRIPSINLPFEFSCDSGLVWPSINYENNVVKKYKPEGAGILGILFQDDDEVGFIYTYPADRIIPIVEIYDLSGNKYGNTSLFELSDCVSDLYYNRITRGIITQDLQLISWIEISDCDDNGENCSISIDTLKQSIY